MGLEMEVSHTDLTSAKGEVADLYIGDKSIVENLEDGKKNIQGLVNLMSKKTCRRPLKKDSIYKEEIKCSIFLYAIF